MSSGKAATDNLRYNLLGSIQSCLHKRFDDKKEEFKLMENFVVFNTEDWLVEDDENSREADCKKLQKIVIWY